jgi:bifunctional DNA-binding transcriptional regulator/antitoxin component of YhaV-PrlF toxin-antitoxin module
MKTTLTVSDDGILTFTPELLEATGWEEGDELEWIDNKDGSFSLVKIALDILLVLPPLRIVEEQQFLLNSLQVVYYP